MGAVKTYGGVSRKAIRVATECMEIAVRSRTIRIGDEAVIEG